MGNGEQVDEMNYSSNLEVWETCQKGWDSIRMASIVVEWLNRIRDPRDQVLAEWRQVLSRKFARPVDGCLVLLKVRL